MVRTSKRTSRCPFCVVQSFAITESGSHNQLRSSRPVAVAEWASLFAVKFGCLPDLTLHVKATSLDNNLCGIESPIDVAHLSQAQPVA